MTRLPAVIAILLASGCVMINTAPKNTPAAAATDPQTVLALTRQWVDAEVAHDRAVLERVLDDRFVMNGSDGKITGKAAFIEAVLATSMVSQTLTDESAQVDGDTATVFGTATIRSLAKGEEKSSAYRYTAVYVRRGAQWRAIALQMARLATAK